MRFVIPRRHSVFLALAIASLLIIVVRPLVFHASAATVGLRRLQTSSAIVDDVATYNFSFTLVTAGTIGSMRFTFCSNSPLMGDPCTAPAGFDASGVVAVNQFGVTGFAEGGSANEILMERSPQPAGSIPVAYRFNNIVNPSVPGPYFARVQTYASGDGTGPATDYGGFAYSISDQVSISTTVPPYLLFCTGVTITGTDCGTASGSYINFGELSQTQARTGSMQLLLATNAVNGYSVTVNGTTMLSGVNSIPAITANDVSRPGTSQFGMNLRGNTDPLIGQDPSGSGSGVVSANYNIPNRYRFISGEQVASTPTSDRYRKYTVSYIVNVANNQSPGIYVSTLTYIATASF